MKHLVGMVERDYRRECLAFPLFVSVCFKVDSSPSSHSPLRIKSATFCDLLERDTEVLSLEVEEKGTTTSVELNLRGFQVISVKFILA